MNNTQLRNTKTRNNLVESTRKLSTSLSKVKNVIIDAFRNKISEHDVEVLLTPSPSDVVQASKKNMSHTEVSPLLCQEVNGAKTKGELDISRNTSEDSIKEVSTPEHLFANESNPISISIMYGIINAAMVLPVLMSFGNIIYRDDFFLPYLPVLVKLTVISGAVHQTCFSLFSSLPFAVGQVQDAGLLFLSQMASQMVKICREQGYDADRILATVTVGLSLYTACLGLGLILIAKCRLASLVQKLPTSVIGGYLAFIGFFCGQSGLSMMSGVEVSGVTEWGRFFTGSSLHMIWPGVVGGCMIYVLVRKIRHMAVLPTCIVGIIVIFYGTLALTGTSIEEARQQGWINQADAPPVWYHTWDYLCLDKVVWSALPPQIPTFIGMVFVVALSSSLDVAAIELELGQPLNYNHELKTVGISNMISGMAGGYTGSYIFSQTIFYLRAGIKSRLAGYIVVLAEVISVILPISLLAYLPNFFFASLLIMICVDLMYEWLWEVRERTTPANYGVALSTFAFIDIIGVEKGILAGLALYLLLLKLGVDMGQIDANYGEDGETLPICDGVNSDIMLNYGGLQEESTKYIRSDSISFTEGALSKSKD